jgi:hypothetical protein
MYIYVYNELLYMYLKHIYIRYVYNGSYKPVSCQVLYVINIQYRLNVLIITILDYFLFSTSQMETSTKLAKKYL